MIYLIDEQIESIDPIEEVNKYIDALFVRRSRMLFTPTILENPVAVINKLSHDELNKDRHTIMFPIATYADVFRLCYTSDNTYLVPSGDNISIDTLSSHGYVSLKTGGSAIVPKGDLPLKTNVYDGSLYEGLINTIPDIDFEEVLFRLVSWTVDTIKLARQKYREITE